MLGDLTLNEQILPRGDASLGRSLETRWIV
jgi:hypothetical protein